MRDCIGVGHLILIVPRDEFYAWKPMHGEPRRVSRTLRLWVKFASTRDNCGSLYDGMGPVLASRTIEGASLSLNKANNGCFMACNAWFVVSSVHGMLVLVASFAIDRITVGTITECRAFAFDGCQENFEHGSIDSLPLDATDIGAETSGMNPGAE